MVPYNLETTNDNLTSRAGLICIAELMEKLRLSATINAHFPQPKSNRGFRADRFVNTMILNLHNDGKCLNDILKLHDEKALLQLLGLKVPKPGSVAKWLSRLGEAGGVDALTEVNRHVLKISLHRCKSVTLDIDATLCASKHKEAQWSYKKCTGYMPMVGTIAETGQVVATDFRAGNVPPAKDNLAFVHQCEAALPQGVEVKRLRIDAAGYQYAIIDDCIEHHIEFAIRAKMDSSLRTLVKDQEEAAWQPLHKRNGDELQGQSTLRLVHTMNDSKQSFEVVVQRQKKTGQLELELDTDGATEQFEDNGYLYRAIATNLPSTNSEVVHWYNERGEHSENRIKELKNDFHAGRVPCSEFAANALYFSICSLAFNLFALLRSVMPAALQCCRAKAIRWYLYAIAGKIVKHGRRISLKVRAAHRELLAQVIRAIQLIPDIL